MLTVASLKGQCDEKLCFRLIYESSFLKPLIFQQVAVNFFKFPKTFETQSAPNVNDTGSK
jgi:hypothetical protein